MSIYDMDCEQGCRLLKVERDKLEAIKTLIADSELVVQISELNEILEAEDHSEA